MKIVRIAAMGAAMVLLSNGAVGCGSEDGNEGDAGTGATPSARATERTGGDAALAVTAADLSFAPATLVAAAGDAVTITLTNGGNAPHTLTVYEDEAYTTAVADADTGTVAGGAKGEFTATFQESKTYYFRCEIHPSQMMGTITVE